MSDNKPKPRETRLFPEADSPATLVVPAGYTAEQEAALVAYLRERAAGNPAVVPDHPAKPTAAP